MARIPANASVTRGNHFLHTMTQEKSTPLTTMREKKERKKKKEKEKRHVKKKTQFVCYKKKHVKNQHP